MFWHSSGGAGRPFEEECCKHIFACYLCKAGKLYTLWAEIHKRKISVTFLGVRTRVKRCRILVCDHGPFVWYSFGGGSDVAGICVKMLSVAGHERT